MKLRTKITLSIGSLLAVIILLGFFAARITENMKKNTENILADNYNSVKYAQQMLSALNAYSDDSLASINKFTNNLHLQKNNITEGYEEKITEELEQEFEKFKSDGSDKNLRELSETITKIILLNSEAIQHKSIIATESAGKSLVWIIVLTLLSSFIAITMLVLFPKSFTRPINKLVEGIIEISNHNYDKRLDFDPKSEFGTVSSSFNNMAAELAQFQKSSISRILSTKRYLETIINSIDQPIIGIDNNNTVMFVNNAALSILSLQPEKMINRSALEISLTNDLFRRLMRGLEGEKNGESLKIYSDNKESYFDVCYRFPEGNSGTVIILSNITKFKELDNAKTNFISVISHELKTPISAILMSLKLLEDERVGHMNEEQSALAQSIRENSDRLLGISGELLKITQVESGGLPLNPKVTKPIELINYAVKATRVLAERFKCNVEIEYPETIQKLFVDSEKIAWVVTNLLSNAIHYSSENSRVIVGARQTGKIIEIYVRDFGKGIDPRYHKTIFDRYFRVPGTKVQGSGLGLAISKDFVEAHGGTISIDSSVGKGSCFTITFTVA